MEMSGYASVDKPWLKFYSDEALSAILPEGSAYDYMYENNRNRLDSYALDYFGRKVTYRELFARIDETERGFLALGIMPGEIITMAVTNTPEAVFCFYAANKIGAVSNMIDLRSSAEEFRTLLNEMGGHIAVILDTCSESIAQIINETGIEKVIVMSPYNSLPFPLSLKKAKLPDDPKFLEWKAFLNLGKGQADFIKYSAAGDDIAVIAHTGGTTGIPKGVEITNNSLNCVAQEYMRYTVPVRSRRSQQLGKLCRAQG